MNFFILGDFPELPENFHIPNYLRMRITYENRLRPRIPQSEQGRHPGESRQNLKSIKNMT